ncbi:sigma 54-interacting transcriptional regulator [Neobacillus drentensis]|uniref:sigma-54 interaction domain-containing protein n=1 Tax=Neobacillus drentensis TaxID=220684 RepID=UPI002FFE9521
MLLSDITQTPAFMVESSMLQHEYDQIVAKMKTLSTEVIPVIDQGCWAGVFQLFSNSFPSGKEMGLWSQDTPFFYEDTEIIDIKLPVKSSLVGVVDKNNKFIGIAETSKIVEQKRVIWAKYKEVFEQHKHLDAVIDSAYDGILITDALGVVTRVNPAMSRFSGILENRFIGRHLTELFSQGVFKEPSITWKALQEKREIIGLQRYQTGQEHIVSAVPIIDEFGKVQGSVATVRDMTELARLREELNFVQKRSQEYQLEILKLRKQVLSDEVIAVSPKMVSVFDLAGRVADFDSTVLILGESGVGKEVLANFIHKNSRRSKGPFVKINCGALPPDLLESELFGYEAGAFTGASRSGKKGLFEAAEGGMIFLDEIGEMSTSLQVKVLRVLQEQEFTRVGGVEPLQVNCRIIAATHRNLQERIQLGLFREDLYYRLYVVPIHIPPLRERHEDIPAMIQYFLNRYNQKHGIQKMIDSQVIHALKNYSWPGNVRQLSNLIERLVVTIFEPTILLHHLPEDVMTFEGPLARTVYHPPMPKGNFEDAIAATNPQMMEITESDNYNAFNVLERDLIIESLTRYGSIRKVGQALGVSHTTVIKKMKKYGITR